MVECWSEGVLENIGKPNTPLLQHSTIPINSPIATYLLNSVSASVAQIVLATGPVPDESLLLPVSPEKDGKSGRNRWLLR
jgi:hypothetical protein